MNLQIAQYISQPFRDVYLFMADYHNHIDVF